MNLELVDTLYRYSAWANQRILDQSAQLEREQFLANMGASFDSVRDTLVHIMGAQWLWLERWKGASPPALPAPEELRDLPRIRERWGEIEAETQAFVAGLDEGALVREVAYRNTQGERWSYPLWQQMIHQVNHATQHRSEAAMILTRFGHSPGWLDFLYYLDVVGQAS